MGSTLARVIPLALGVALSPLPMIAVLVILLTARARVSSLVFVVSWVAGNIIAITIAITFAGKIHPPRHGMDIWWESAITALLGIGLIAIGWYTRRGRLHSPDPDAVPRWVNAADNLSPIGGSILALSNAVTSPKNLALALAAGAFIRNGLRRPEQWVTAGFVYVAVASLTIAAPVLLYFVAGARATPILQRWRNNITARSAVISEMTLLVLGVVLSVRGLWNLLT